jgi:FAD/FMN-containing dehydrogenase
VLTRRRLLVSAAGLAALPLGCRSRGDAPPIFAPRNETPTGVLLDDVHSRLNATRVAEVVPVDGLEALQAAVRRARDSRMPVSIAGGRHAMGGQQFANGALHLDTRALARVLSFDSERGILEVEAGIHWPELVDAYLKLQRDDPATPGGEARWGIAQKQTGADRLSIGGALSANAHGRGLTMKPMVGDVEAFTLVDARGELVRCSRSDNPELFALAIGGYGLFGAIYSVELRLVPRRKLERVVEIRGTEGLADAFERRIAEGFLYGDFQFAIDPAEPTFLQEGVFSCYRPVDTPDPIPEGQRELADAQWAELLYLAHAQPSEAYRLYSRYYLSTSGQLYWSETQQMGFYSDDYHGALDRRLGATAPGSEMISELYVPREELTGFLTAAGEWLRESGAEVVYGTVRWIERDDVTFLPWAKRRWACTVMNLHVDHSAEGIARAERQFRGLIDLARERGGSYFLTYHRWATREQLDACYPEMPAFLRRKLQHDPEERFQSEWYRHLRALYPAL